MTLLIALALLSFAALSLGMVIGLAHGIEVQRKRGPRPVVLGEGEAMPREEELTA